MDKIIAIARQKDGAEKTITVRLPLFTGIAILATPGFCLSYLEMNQY